MDDKKVTVLTPNGRRQVVKVTPNVTLLEILENVCAKHGYNSEEFCLRHHNKEVGLTQIFRFSGLPNNCLLEMTPAMRKRVESPVEICVTLEDGLRIQGQFNSGDNLWHVLEQLCTEAAGEFQSPVAIYMRKEIIGKTNLANTTLKSLGITEGRAMIRFINKNPDELKIQANVYIPPVAKEAPTKENDALPKGSGSKDHGSGSGFAITNDVIQSLKQMSSTNVPDTSDLQQANDQNDKPESDSAKFDWGAGAGRTLRNSEIDVAAENDAEKERLEAQIKEEPNVIIIGERNAIIFSLDDTQKKLEELPDSFFDLTVSDLKLVLSDLRNVARGNEDTPLLTEKLRELEENKTMLSKLAQYKNCVIRVQFPDRHVLQGMFKPIDKVSNVIEFVRQFLDNENAMFHLFTIPPKKNLPLDKTLLELDLVPTSVMHFALNDEVESAADVEPIYVKPELLEKLTSFEGAVFAANKFRISNRRPLSEEYNDASAAGMNEYPPGPSTGAIPKRPRTDVNKST